MKCSQMSTSSEHSWSDAPNQIIKYMLSLAYQIPMELNIGHLGCHVVFQTFYYVIYYECSTRFGNPSVPFPTQGPKHKLNISYYNDENSDFIPNNIYIAS